MPSESRKSQRDPRARSGKGGREPSSAPSLSSFLPLSSLSSAASSSSPSFFPRASFRDYSFGKSERAPEDRGREARRPPRPAPRSFFSIQPLECQGWVGESMGLFSTRLHVQHQIKNRVGGVSGGKGRTRRKRGSVSLRLLRLSSSNGALFCHSPLATGLQKGKGGGERAGGGGWWVGGWVGV